MNATGLTKRKRRVLRASGMISVLTLCSQRMKRGTQRIQGDNEWGNQRILEFHKLFRAVVGINNKF